ncbi:hypothetical protein Cni_G05832 [Canna indica]|uniref:CCHC-type domain-containing protein n=1 Tax=Canna indica TaxID=4628 RepID=A0AAQ3JXL1_9LILI|nr:hypothetical protein Cni_G05832 [Canna indica]
MTDMKHAIDFAEPCGETKTITDKESGAGANAASAAEMVLITTSPLSELIWTPQEGLSLKYAESSKAEKKPSFMWKAESFNMIISTSQCVNGGECSTSRDHIAGDSIVQSNHNSHNNGDPVAFLGHSRRRTDSQPTSFAWLHPQDTRSYGDKELVKDRDVADLDLNQLAKDDVDPYPLRNTECFETINPAKDMIDKIPNNIFSPGPSPEIAETTAGFASTDIASNERPTQKVRIAEYDKSCLIGVSGSNYSVFAKSGKSTSSISSAECTHIDLALCDTEEDSNEEPKNPACLLVYGGRNSFGTQSKDKGCQNKDGWTVAKHSQEVDKDETQNGYIKNETDEFRYLSKCNVYPGNFEKGKEKILYDDDYDSSSKEKEDSSESAESSNSRRLLSKGKRAFTYDLEISKSCKKIKWENDERSCTTSFFRKDSSFVNWISTIAGSFSTYDQNMTSLALLPQSYNSMKENFGSLRTSQEQTEGVMSKTVGFKSFFQALYCPSIMFTNTMNDDDHQREVSTSKDIKMFGDQNNYSGNRVLSNFLQFKLNKTIPTRGEQTYNGLKEFHLTSQALAISSLHILCSEDTSKSGDQVSPSSKRHNQISDHVDNIPSIMINICSSRPKIIENLKQSRGQTHALQNMNNASSSARKDFICAEEKGNATHSSDPNSQLNMTSNNKNGLFKNLWVSRFLQKVSSPILNSVKCNLRIDDKCDLSTEKRLQKNHTSAQLESQRDSAGEAQKQPSNPTFPCGLNRLNAQLLNRRISPIIPFGELKKTELGQIEASCSRKRFDLNPSKKLHNHNVSCALVTCFFCGKRGHSLRECPELEETNLLDFQNFVDSYDGKDISSCFCMCCFQADHWAISCPRASLKIKKTSSCSFSKAHGNCNVTEKKPENHDIFDYVGKSNLWSLDNNKQHIYRNKLLERGDSERETHTLIPRSIYAGGIASPTQDVLEDYPAESMVNTKQKDSNSLENGSRGNQIIPLYKCIVPNVTNEENEIFKALRRLRLSRTNVIRWMKSANASYSIDGFFVRLRLGKWEKGLGGTGYHVAQIISSSRENRLSVTVGKLKCSLEYCFVSNQDYMEEELKAWLSATLAANGKLPSIEELNKKVKERGDLGF